MDLTGIATVALAALTLLSLAVAVVALRRASADAKAARTADLSWNVYQAYDSRELRQGRRVLNTVSRKKPVPRSGKEFGNMYITDSSHEKEVSTGSIGRMLRFYHQIGILLAEDLIDADFIFSLIGDGLNTSKEGIRAAVEWNQNYYGEESGNQEAPRRYIYEKARQLPGMYMKWEEAGGSAFLTGGVRSPRRRRASRVNWRQARPGLQRPPRTEDQERRGSDE